MLQDRAAMLTGVGIGAGLMFLLDPATGRRRRALMRDKCVRAAHRTGDAAGATGRDIANRATGVAARVRGAMHGEGDDDDQVLAERVRAQIGRIVSHPHALSVTASDGVVTLRGPILRDEAARLCRKVEGVRGVHDVVSLLEEHDDATGIPALQGGRERPGFGTAVLHGQWSPTTRVMTALIATVGAGMIARAAVSGNAPYLRH